MSTTEKSRNAGVPKIRVTKDQVDRLFKRFHDAIDEDVGADLTDLDKNSAKASKHLFKGAVTPLFEIVDKPEVTIVGVPGKLVSVEARGDQGAGKTLLLGLLDTIDQSVRSENGNFHEALITLNAIIQDYGVFGLALTIPQGHNLVTEVKPGYDGLFGILQEALAQAQQGKGNERHNPTGAVPFEEQRMQTISSLIRSPKGMEYQVIKKITEGLDMPELDRQVKELLGAIVYLAGMIIFLRTEAGVLPGGTNA